MMSQSSKAVIGPPGSWLASWTFLVLLACGEPSGDGADDAARGDTAGNAAAGGDARSQPAVGNRGNEAGDDSSEPAAPAAGPVVEAPSAGPPAPPGALAACADLSFDTPTAFPRTVLEAVRQINALPRPASLPCYIASLPRPLALVSTSNITSAQPADGRRSPRIFIMSDALILSIVPSGDGRMLLEFGEFVDAYRTLKAEVEFPVDAPLSDDEPFTRVKFDERLTNCGFCHREEQAHATIPEGFVSLAIGVQPGTEVPTADVRTEYKRCDPGEEPYRCEMLQALFAFGPVTQGAFPEGLSLFL